MLSPFQLRYSRQRNCARLPFAVCPLPLASCLCRLPFAFAFALSLASAFAFAFCLVFECARVVCGGGGRLPEINGDWSGGGFYSDSRGGRREGRATQYMPLCFCLLCFCLRLNSFCFPLLSIPSCLISFAGLCIDVLCRSLLHFAFCLFPFAFCICLCMCLCLCRCLCLCLCGCIVPCICNRFYLRLLPLPLDLPLP